MNKKISVVINTFNEEKNIENVLRSVCDWVDEIIIVDMYSDDKTLEIAKKFNVKMYMHPRIGYVEPARKYAVNLARNDWILILDADEIVSKKMSISIRKEIIEKNSDVIYLPRKNYFFGNVIENTGWGPDQDRQMRLFNRKFIDFSDKIHSIPKAKYNARIKILKNDESGHIIHFPYLNSEQFIAKLNSYTSIEAKELLNKDSNPSVIKITIQLIKVFIIRYLYLRGYKDGWNGFYLSLMMVFYKLSVYGKLKELQNSKLQGIPQEKYRIVVESELNNEI